MQTTTFGTTPGFDNNSAFPDVTVLQLLDDTTAPSSRRGRMGRGEKAALQFLGGFTLTSGLLAGSIYMVADSFWVQLFSFLF